MDGFEAARIVFSRIQKLVQDPKTASKIIGLLLLKHHGDQEMIRLACCPESHLHSVILSLKSPDHLSFLTDLHLNSNPSLTHADLEAEEEEEESTGTASKQQCLYFTRGFCKNGNACRFLHHAADLGGVHLQDSSPTTAAAAAAAAEIMEQQHRHQLFRSKSFDPRLAGPSSPYLNDKYMNLLLQNQLANSPGSMFMGGDLPVFGQTGFKRGLFHMNGALDMVNPDSRQIYLTFPADTSFREEDVSNYFSIFGPVQDVRIPYQQKRMFGFVTFVYPETVKTILAKGNPHFVCDARVLVKPYKEKGKVPDRYRNLLPLNRGDHFTCISPTGLGPRDPFDNQIIGPGMSSNQDILLRWKLEQHADLQQAVERQSQRLMGMRLQDANRQHHQRAFSMGGMAIPSPTHAGSHLNWSFGSSSASSSPESIDGNFYSPQNGTPPSYDPEMHSFNQLSFGASKERMQNYNTGTLGDTTKGSSVLAKNGDLPESHDSVNLEQYLPESPFGTLGEVAVYTSAETESSNEIAINTIPGASIPSALSASKNLTRLPFSPAASTLEMAKSCYLHLPRLSASHSAIEM